MDNATMIAAARQCGRTVSFTMQTVYAMIEESLCRDGVRGEWNRHGRWLVYEKPDMTVLVERSEE